MENQPTRPENDHDGRITPYAVIEDPKDSAPRGYVYKVPDGSLFFIPMDRDSGRNYLDRTVHLKSLCLDSPVNSAVPENWPRTYRSNALGELGDKPDPETMKWILTAFCGGKHAASYLTEHSHS
jgi:hypothetical protein